MDLHANLKGKPARLPHWARGSQRPELARTGFYQNGSLDARDEPADRTNRREFFHRPQGTMRETS